MMRFHTPVEDERSALAEHLVVRVVPITSHQLRALESLERALFGLAADFQRDFGTIDGDGDIAGGLYRLWSTLGVITTSWKETAEDAETVERRRTALQRIRDAAADEDAREIAAEALR